MALKKNFRQIPWQRRALLVLLGSATGFSLALPGQAQTVEANTAAANAGQGGKGAQIYCFMRTSGNKHQVSWDAAYAVTKRQSDKLFKTSPEHAAVMITEAVVQNPSVFPDCGRYLGDLFTKPEIKPEASPATGGTSRY
ncbi:MAG: penicillin amidase [Cyanobacteria bacterium]|nr:penicillin amidase [Cyanobacteriota bacterium]